MTTFDDILSDRLREDPAEPVLTFYDHASGERVELSVATYANWVEKTAGLLADECDAEHGGHLHLSLPPHWLGPVFLGAAWMVGLVVTTSDAELSARPGPDVVACGPEGLARWGDAPAQPVVASALLPLAARFSDPLPAGVLDFGVEIWSQPDTFTAPETPSGDDEAVPGTSQHALWTAAAAGTLLDDGGRLYSEVNPATPDGLSSFTEPFARHGSVVLVAHPDPEQVEATCAEERVTTRRPRVTG